MNIDSTANAMQAAVKAMSQAQASAAAAAQRIATSQRTAEAADIVALITAETQFQAGAAVLKTADETTGALLDIKT
ncbi:MAG: hypothetical protein RIB84_22280 [Sneathiellaceae bacterium]